MAHIERGQCPRISVRQFQALRARKVLIKDFLADPERFRLPDMYEPMVVRGRVHLLDSLVDEDAENMRVFDIPVLTPASRLDSAPQQRKEEQVDRLIPDAAMPVIEDREEPKTTVARAATTMDTTTTRPNEPTALPAKRQIRPVYPYPAQWDPRSSSFDPQRFKHPITARFVCPFPFCKSVQTRRVVTSVCTVRYEYAHG